MARRRPTIHERLEALAVNPVPAPFDVKLGAIIAIVSEMRDEAKKFGVNRKFTPDGRFVGDIGELIAKIHYGVILHETQAEGEDGVCQISGKVVEVKLRTKDSPVWVKKIPEFLVAIYLSPVCLKWGVVCNGPGAELLKNTRWNDSHKRYETTLSKLLSAQDGLPPNSPSVPQRILN